jgi:dTDP-4-dehydrorhamnose 3,5-epimerase
MYKILGKSKKVDQMLDKPLLLRHPNHNDNRGEFGKIFSKDSNIVEGLSEFQIKEINYSKTMLKNSIRGFHIQLGSYNEAKLVKCIQGEIYDVVVDLRKNSDTFLKSTSFQLNANVNELLFIPHGYAHGFQTIENKTILTYFHDNYYNKSSEFSIRYNDPMIEVSWPNVPSNISKKDLATRLLSPDFKGFEFEM